MSRLADSFQESLLRAFDTLALYRISQLDADQTVIATIVQCNNSLTGEYLVKTNGGTMKAYAQGDATYGKDETVYVLVPKGDYSEKKMILSTYSSGNTDNLTFVTSVTNNYNVIGGDCIFDENKLLPVGLCSYYVQDRMVLYVRDGDNPEVQELTVNQEDLATYISSAEAILVQADFSTALPRDHRNSTTGNYGIQIICAFKNKNDPENEEAITYTPYVLDVSDMVGNPYQYNTPSTQQAMFEIDAENFLYIDSIIAFSEGFVEEDNEEAATVTWGDDIFVHDIQVYGLQEISATSGDYTLKLSTPQGSIFKRAGNETEESVTLQVVGRVTYKVTQDLSQDTTFYWGKEDMEIDANSDYYNSYLGKGWKHIVDAGSTQSIVTSMKENPAYENKWLCCAVYQEQVVLKQEFTLINQSAKGAITIVSNLGERFSFDRGTPTLTCLVYGKSSEFDIPNYKDDDFRFVWARVDPTSGTIVLDMSADEIQQKIDEMVANGIPSYTDYIDLKNKLSQMKGVVISGDRGNILTYPVSNITNLATFKCTVYRKRSGTTEDIEDNIGTGFITLYNASEVGDAKCYILIENGDQVFQYSESGVSPASDRLTDPLVVDPLICHFFDEQNQEVNPSTYTLVWKFPTEATMIEKPDPLVEGSIVTNEANGVAEYCPLPQYPLSIKEDYDYQALNNQVTAIVTYDGRQFTQDTNFLFVKVGDNGTNGTDVVTKIVVSNENNGTMEDIDIDAEQYGVSKAVLCVEEREGIETLRWNNEAQLLLSPLKLLVYRRNVDVSKSATSTRWTVCGGSKYSNRMSIDSQDGTLSFADNDTEETEVRLNNYIARASCSLDAQDYYCFYPVVYSWYKDDSVPRIYLDKYKTLKYVTYNADGRVPLYNKNQGVFFANMPFACNVTFKVEGGVENNENTANLKLFTKTIDDVGDIKESEKTNEISLNVVLGEPVGVFVEPLDIYTGEYSNNNVIVEIKVSTELVARFIVPIEMHLNTFGLASLNAWDGKHVEINEDENYILAPQIGAGIKDDDNTFTGVVMGKMEFYENKADNTPTVGLMGFSKGKQSILLDAETGNAIFGLPETQASTNFPYEEGRIELIPGGESKIGNWRIGSRNLYGFKYVNDDGTDRGPLTEADAKYRYGEYEDQQKPGVEIPEEDKLNLWDTERYTTKSGEEENGTWYDDLVDGVDTFPYRGNSITVGKKDEDEPVVTINPSPAPSMGDIKADFSIPHAFGTGIILSQKPAYVSVKGKPLDSDDGLDFTSANQEINRGDSLEVEINPNSKDIFTIYRHTNKVWRTGHVKPDIVNWYRVPMVGINAEGKFYTNSIRDGESSMGIGYVGAYGQQAVRHTYVGAQFSYGDGNNILKFFQHANEDGTTYISGGSQTDTEYNKNFVFATKDFTVYTDDGKSVHNNTLTTNNYLKMTSGTNSSFEIAHLTTRENDDGENVEELGRSTLKLSARGNTLLQSYDGSLSLKATGSDNDVSLDGRNYTGNLTGSSTSVVKDDISVTSNSGNISYMLDTRERSYKFSIAGNTDYPEQSMELTKQMFKFGNTTNYLHLNLNTEGSAKTPISELNVASDVLLRSRVGTITIRTEAEGNTLQLEARTSLDSEIGSSVIHLEPSADGYSRIDMRTGGGQIVVGKTLVDATDTQKAVYGVQITPGMASGFLKLTGGSSGDNNTLAVNGQTSVIGNIMQYCGNGNEGVVNELQPNGAWKQGYYETYLNMAMIQGANTAGNGLQVERNALIKGQLTVNKQLTVNDILVVTSNWLDVGSSNNYERVTREKIIKWDNYESNLSNINGDISAMKTSISGLGTDICALFNTVSGLSTNVNNLTSNLGTANVSYNGITERLSTTLGKFSNLINTNINDISDLKRRVSALERG